MEENSKAKDSIDISKIFRNYLRHWWWFAISLVVCMGLSAIYLKKKSPVYSIKSMIMVNQDEDEPSSPIGALGSLIGSFGGGVGANGVSVDDELLKVASHSRLVDLIHTHDLNFNYWSTSGFLNKKNWLYNSSPIKIELPQAVLDTLSAYTRFHFEIPKQGNVKIEVKQNGKNVLNATINSWPYRARTPYATFTINKTHDFVPGKEVNLYATAIGTEEVAADLTERLGVNLASKKSDAIEIDFEEVSVARGIDLVNSLINNYNNIRLNDRVEAAQNTLRFVENRLIKLYNELETSESRIESYKKENNIVNAEAEAEYIFTRKGTIEASYVTAKTRLEILKMVRDMLSQSENQYSLIPFAGSGSELGESFANMLTAYNELVLKRMELESSAKGQNSQLSRLTAQIDAMRRNILSSVGREIESTKISLSNISSEEQQSSSRIKEIPSMEHQLVMLYRDREVKNQIYAYLLQKREEAEVTVAKQTPVAKVIDSAYVLPKPISPNKVVVLLIGFLAGLLIPIILLRVRNSRNINSTTSSEAKKA